jgi:hypothetical protein
MLVEIPVGCEDFGDWPLFTSVTTLARKSFGAGYMGSLAGEDSHGRMGRKSRQSVVKLSW